MQVVRTDGGRAAAGFKGSAGDCVARAVAIASGRPYAEVYARLAAGMGSQRQGKRRRKSGASARNGVSVRRQWFKGYMRELGAEWTPTMQIGSGCKVHLTDGELPMGRLVVSVSKHYTAVIDGVIHDTHDPQREPETTVCYKAGATDSRSAEVSHTTISGGRCVYGYWRFPDASR